MKGRSFFTRKTATNGSILCDSDNSSCLVGSHRPMHLQHYSVLYCMHWGPQNGFGGVRERSDYFIKAAYYVFTIVWKEVNVAVNDEYRWQLLPMSGRICCFGTSLYNIILNWIVSYCIVSSHVVFSLYFFFTEFYYIALFCIVSCCAVFFNKW